MLQQGLDTYLRKLGRRNHLSSSLSSSLHMPISCSLSRSVGCSYANASNPCEPHQQHIRCSLCGGLTSILRLTFRISSFSSAESSRCRSIGPLQSRRRGSWYVCKSARRRRMEVVICCASEDIVGTDTGELGTRGTDRNQRCAEDGQLATSTRGIHA